jgi:hypothetical protein
MRARALVLTRAFVGLVRGALPADRDGELCAARCAEPSMCDGRTCWVSRLVEKSARTRATLGAPGRRRINHASVYLDRLAKRRGA